jgi:hypothetical protein
MATVTTAHVEPVELVEPPVPSIEPPVDHVRTHGPRCLWDLRDCRWDCSGA